MIVLDNGNVSVPFSRTNGVHTFTDALVMPPNVYDALTPDEIKTMQDARFAAWLNFVIAASNDAEVTNG